MRWTRWQSGSLQRGQQRKGCVSYLTTHDENKSKVMGIWGEFKRTRALAIEGVVRIMTMVPS